MEVTPIEANDGHVSTQGQGSISAHTPEQEAQEGSSSKPGGVVRAPGHEEDAGAVHAVQEGSSSKPGVDVTGKEGGAGEEKRSEDENDKDILTSIFSALPGIHQFEGMVSSDL
jgi:hypothetical protein